jgi:DNA-binding MarR family transcriptional regulator
VIEVTPSDAAPLVQQWRDLARSFTTISCRLDKALHEQHGLGMSDFEILDRLVEGCNDSVRMQELADAVHLSQSALSRAVARLDKDGLVEREMCDMDRRGVFVRMTEAGLARWQEACPTHRAVLEESFATFQAPAVRA